MDFFSAVSVVSISTFSLREVEIPSADAMVSVFSRVFATSAYELAGLLELEQDYEWEWGSESLSGFARLVESFRNHVYLIKFRNDYK